MVLIHIFVLYATLKASFSHIVVHTEKPNDVECVGFQNSTLYWCFYETPPDNLKNFIVSEPDESVRYQRCQYNPPWHLKAISNHNLYDYPQNELLSHVYVVDTYIDHTHPGFEGRVTNVYGDDLYSTNPHGTHVAGLVGSSMYGVNKNVRIFGVTVLNGDGYTTWSRLIRALSFISEHSKSQTVTSIVNLSIAGGPSVAVDEAISALERQGILVIAAAGNSNDDACTFSPARSAAALTVGAVDEYMVSAQFSNYGRCVDLQAPGSLILSLVPGGSYGYMSGTSMAAPIVAGIVSLFTSRYKYSKSKPRELREILLFATRRNVISGLRNQTPNLMAFQPLKSQCLSGSFLYYQ